MDRRETYSFEKTNPYVCSNYGLPLPVIPEEKAFRHVREGDVIEAGEMKFEVIETPGHSAGGLCFLEREGKILLSGDTLFAGAIGRSDHPGGDYDVLMNSIFTKLMCLDGDIEVIPGHGPATDIAKERMTNPFLMPFNEPYEE
jgi:glyoxylase-like metal-dependent hydrolase (beta-lactamase superfamily II)